MGRRRSALAVALAALAAGPVSSFHAPALLPRAAGPWGAGAHQSPRTASQPLQPGGTAFSALPSAAARAWRPTGRRRATARASVATAPEALAAAAWVGGPMGAWSQTPELDPLPLPPHPGLVQGVLPNGLRFVHSTTHSTTRLAVAAAC